MTSLDDLFELPLEALDLAPESIKVLKWDRIASVGDCLIFYVREAQNRMFTTAKTRLLMYSEVFNRLVALGCWELIEDREVWRWLARTWQHRIPKQLVEWQGKERDLRHIPIEELGLSEEALACLRRFWGNMDISFWIDMCIRTKLSEPLRTKLEPALEVLEPKFKELGYWFYIEHPDSFDVNEC